MKEAESVDLSTLSEKRAVFTTSKGVNITLNRLSSTNSSRFREALAPLKESLTEDNFLAYVENFALESNVHGLKEIYKAKTHLGRLFWTSVWLLCVTAAIYEIFQVIIAHQADSTATKVTVNPTDSLEYPDVLFCPVKWISRSRVQRLNVSRDQLAFALSLLQTDLTINRRRLQVANESETEKELIRLLHRHNISTYAEFYQAISLPPKSLFKRRLECEGVVAQVQTIVTLSGVCYVLQICNRSSENEVSPRVRYTSPENDTYDVPVVSNGAFISLHNPKSQISRAVSHQMFLVPGRPVLANLDLIIYKRVNHGRYECEKSNNSRGYIPSLTECRWICLDLWLFQRVGNCSLLSIFTVSPVHRQCKYDQVKQKNQLLSDLELESRRLVQKCQQQCKPQCEEKFYNAMSMMMITTINRTEYFGPNKDKYEFMMTYNAFRYVLFEDVDTSLNFDNLLSLIGGQMGLWCGASVISFIQVVSYCCCPCLHYIEMKTRLQIERGLYKSKSRRNADPNMAKQVLAFKQLQKCGSVL